jgi:hypothetical protein
LWITCLLNLILQCVIEFHDGVILVSCGLNTVEFEYLLIPQSEYSNSLCVNMTDISKQMDTHTDSIRMLYCGMVCV